MQESNGMLEVKGIVNSNESKYIIKKQEEYFQRGPESDEFYGENEVPILEFIQKSIVQQVEEDIKIDPSSEEVDRILENQSKKDLIQNLS